MKRSRVLPLVKLKMFEPLPDHVRLQRRVYGNVRSRLQMYFNRVNYTRHGSAEMLERFLGCDAEQLVQHIESLMLPGMTWDNYSSSGWHIDHITPLSAFDFSSRQDAKAACHYSNLQPLWSDWNISKGGRNRQVTSRKAAVSSAKPAP